jgi:hypothetical protein
MHLSRFRPRFTVRRLMIAVAIAAFVSFLFGAKNSNNRRAIYRQTAAEFRTKELGAMPFNPEHPLWKDDMRLSLNQPSYTIKPKNLAYYTRMRQKYEWAAEHSWRPVESDPPEPD